MGSAKYCPTYTQEIKNASKEKDKLEDESYSIGDEIMYTESSIDEKLFSMSGK